MVLYHFINLFILVTYQQRLSVVVRYIIINLLYYTYGNE